MPLNRKTLKVFDFFAGCGSTSCGFQTSGMKIVYALDQDNNALSSFKTNFPNAQADLIDIGKTNIEYIKKIVKNHSDPVLFSGCAPCQPFSNQNTLRPDQNKDDRYPLLSYFGIIVENCLPDLVFLENVPGLQKFYAENQIFRGLYKNWRKWNINTHLNQ